MGLDITAYRDAVWVRPGSDNDDYDWEGGTEAQIGTNEEHHLERMDGLKAGIYKVGGALSFRAGSYGGYNDWRETLCKLALETEPRTIWEDRERFEGLPFVELIDFSDCEGVIGPVTSAKLRDDFIKHEPLLCKYPDDYWVEKYRHWLAAFTLAAQNGFVDFH